MNMNEHQDNTPERDPLTPGALEDEPVSVSESLSGHNEPAHEDQESNIKAIDPNISRIEELEAELAKSKDQTLRALAEAENTRRRAQKEREDASSYGISKFARDLLNVSDNLRRALEAIPEDLIQADNRLPGIMTGIEATEKELLKAFQQNGIEKVEPLDEKFDPNVHEVMFEAPMPDKPNGTIIQVIEAGYILKGRLLRAAKVGIAKNENEPQKNENGHIIDEEA